MRLYFEYMGELVHRNTEGGYKLRYYCFHSLRGMLRADTQESMKQLIKQRSKNNEHTTNQTMD